MTHRELLDEIRRALGGTATHSAAELARYILRGLEKRDIAEGSLLKKSERATLSDGVYTLNFRGEYIENISVVKPRES